MRANAQSLQDDNRLPMTDKKRPPMPEDQRDAEINRRIDENLRKVFQEQVEEDLPDRFKLLLDQLRQQDGDDGEDDQA